MSAENTKCATSCLGHIVTYRRGRVDKYQRSATQVERTSSVATYEGIASWIEHVNVGELSTTVSGTRRSNGRKTASSCWSMSPKWFWVVEKMRTAVVVDLAVNYDRQQLRWTSVRSPYRSWVLPRRTVTRLSVYLKADSLTRESDAVANFSVEVDDGGRPRSEQRMIAAYRSVSTRSKCTVNVLAGCRGECPHAVRWSWHWPASPWTPRSSRGNDRPRTSLAGRLKRKVLMMIVGGWPATSSAWKRSGLDGVPPREHVEGS